MTDQATLFHQAVERFANSEAAGRLTVSEETILAQALEADGLTGEWAAKAEAADIVGHLHQLDAHVCVGAHCPHPSHHDPLPDAAKARTGDPDTSKQAALTIENMTERQFAVLTVAEMFPDDFTHEDLIWRYECRRADGNLPTHARAKMGTGWELPQQADSSIRSRCAELYHAGLIVVAGKGQSFAGHPCKTWRVA